MPLPGGDFPHDGVARLTHDLKARFPFLSDYWAGRLVRAYGSEAATLLGDAKAAADLGRDFGATLTETEVRWLMTREFARCGGRCGLAAHKAWAADDGGPDRRAGCVHDRSRKRRGA